MINKRFIGGVVDIIEIRVSIRVKKVVGNIIK